MTRLYLLLLLLFGGALCFYDVCQLNTPCPGSHDYILWVDGEHVIRTLNATARPVADINYVAVERPGVLQRWPRLVRRGANATYGRFDGFYIEAPLAAPIDVAALEAVADKSPAQILELAMAYEHLSRFEEALEAYQARIDLKGWAPGHFYAQYRLGVVQLALNQTQAAAKSLLLAYIMDPSRYEPLYYLARLARVEKDYPLCLLYSGAAMQLGSPWADALQVETDIWRLEDERAVCLFYTNRKADAKFHWERLVNLVPANVQERIKNNLKFV